MNMKLAVEKKKKLICMCVAPRAYTSNGSYHTYAYTFIKLYTNLKSVLVCVSFERGSCITSCQNDFLNRENRLYFDSFPISNVSRMFNFRLNLQIVLEK